MPPASRPKHATVAAIVVTGPRGAVRVAVVLADMQVEKRLAGEAVPAQRAGGVERHGHREGYEPAGRDMRRELARLSSQCAPERCAHLGIGFDREHLVTRTSPPAVGAERLRGDADRQ